VKWRDNNDDAREIWRDPGIAAGCGASCRGGVAAAPGLWEVVVQADVGGAASAPPPSRMCLSQKDIDDSSKTLPKPSTNCTIVTPKTTDDKTSYDIVCPGPSPMRGRADLRSSPNSYDGTIMMTMKSAPNQPDRPVKFTFAGRRIGDCGKAK
jgi:hypothetical protein